jgi:hypothetical protein
MRPSGRLTFSSYIRLCFLVSIAFYHRVKFGLFHYHEKGIRKKLRMLFSDWDFTPVE